MRESKILWHKPRSGCNIHLYASQTVPNLSQSTSILPTNKHWDPASRYYGTFQSFITIRHKTQRSYTFSKYIDVNFLQVSDIVGRCHISFDSASLPFAILSDISRKMRYILQDLPILDDPKAVHAIILQGLEVHF